MADLLLNENLLSRVSAVNRKRVAEFNLILLICQSIERLFQVILLDRFDKNSVDVGDGIDHSVPRADLGPASA